MGRETRIDELLSLHEAARAEGRVLCPEELCRDCPDLLEHVRRHIADLRTMDSLLASRPDGIPFGNGSEEDAPALSPDSIAGYEVVGQLGRGGMGVVYQVRQTSLGRMAALKLIYGGGHATPGERARFRTEAEATARLQHPNVVQVYEVGEYNGQPYLLLEFLEGGNLGRRLGGTPLPPREAAQLVETLARATHYAHGRGVVHRDLTPSNVLLTAEGNPKITDFGLAKLLVGGANRTVSGTVLGTPSYMAPEQAAGSVSSISPSTDVYALGAILYECLTGRAPFRADTAFETLRQVIAEEPVAPRSLSPLLPLNLEVICLKCLSKAPHQRYASAEDLAEDLRRFLNHEPIRARPAAAPERAVKWARRHPVLAVLLATAGLWLVSLVVYTLQRQRDFEAVEAEADRARRAETLAREHEDQAQVLQYAAQMRLASQMLDAGDVFQLPGLLDRYDPAAGAAADHRGFEWWYLRQHRRAARPSLAAHDGPLHLLAYTPDGRSLWTAGGHDSRQAIKCWDRPTGQLRWQRTLGWGNSRRATVAAAVGLTAGVTPEDTIALWDAGDGSVRSHLRAAGFPLFICLSPDGHRLAAAGPGPPVLWNCAAKATELTLPDAAGRMMAFSPDGRTLVTDSNDPDFRGLQWWDTATRKLVRREIQEAALFDLSYSPQGTYVLVVGSNTQGTLWHNAPRAPLAASESLGHAQSLAISPDEQTLAIGGIDGSVLLWAVNPRSLRARYRWQANPIFRLAFSSDGRSLAAATSEGTVYEVDATARQFPDGLHAELPPGSDLAWGPDGKTLAVLGTDQNVRLFDAPTARLRSVLPVPGGRVYQIAFSPDGRTLATVSPGEKFARLWEVAEGRQERTSPPHPAVIDVLAFAPDGRLACAGRGHIQFCDPRTDAVSGVLTYSGGLETLAFTPDGRWLLAAGDYVQVWDLRGEWPQRPAFVAPVLHTDHLAVAPDGRSVATGESSGRVVLWQLSSNGRLSQVGAPIPAAQGPDRLTGLTFTADSRTLLVAHLGNIDFWELPARTLPLHIDGDFAAAVLSSDGRSLAALRHNGTLEFWDVDSRRVQRPSGQGPRSVRSLAFSPDGRTLVTGTSAPWQRVISARGRITCQSAALSSTAETVRLWDVATGREVETGSPGEPAMAPPSLVGYSPDGRTLAAGGEDGSIWIWDRSAGKLRSRLFVSAAAEGYARSMELARSFWADTNPDYEVSTERLTALAFSHDARWLVTAGSRGSVRVWSTENWQRSLELPKQDGPVPWVGFTPDGRRLAASRRGQVRLWGLQSGTEYATLGEEFDAPVHCGAISPAGRLLAVGSNDRAIRVWDMATGKVKVLPGHQDQVTALAFTPDGRTLASASWDRTVRLWSVEAGVEVAVLNGHSGKVQALAFSPDGQVLASGSDKGEVLLWRGNPP
jgi:WD40 repeat protein